MRTHSFIVSMQVPDDDQTDPSDMVETLSELLNREGGAAASWQEAYNDMTPESRPVFEVAEIPNIRVPRRG